MKVAFITDSGTGKNKETLKEKGIFSVPLQIECDGVSYDELETVSYAQVIEWLHQGKVCKTSLPRLAYIQDLFEQLKADGYDTVFCVPICKGLSGCFNAMEMMANQMELKFYGVDCFVTAVVQEHMIETAKRMYEEGKEFPEIIDKLEQMASSCETVLLCDDLQHMKRGGRLTPVAAALGGLLKIKPILVIDKETQGRVDVLDKVRTISKAQDKVISFIQSKGITEDYVFILAHVDAKEAAEKYVERIKNTYPNAKFEIIDLVSAVGIHTGLGCLALQVFKD
ncbi:MAG: DegV family protein [Bacillota bacterium]|nr:DegV family protein [Bacillota bacterium]